MNIGKSGLEGCITYIIPEHGNRIRLGFTSQSNSIIFGDMNRKSISNT